MSERIKKLPTVWQAKWIDPELAHDKDERQPASVLKGKHHPDTPLLTYISVSP